MTSRENILAGRQALDKYEVAHADLHRRPWTSDVSSKHTPLYSALRMELSAQGFADVKSFLDAERTQDIADKRAALRGSSFRFLDLTGTDIYNLLPTIEAIVTERQEDKAANTIVYYYPSGEYVLAGRDADLNVNLRVGLCRQKGVPILMTLVGGKAGLIGGTPLRALVTKNVFLDLQDAMDSELQVGLELLRLLGISATRSETNDIVAEGKKVGSSCWAIFGDTILTHSGIVLDFDFDAGDELLYFPGVDVRKQMGTITALLGRQVTHAEFGSLLFTAYQDVLGISFEEGILSAKEVDLRDSLRPKYLSEAWLFRKPNGS